SSIPVLHQCFDDSGVKIVSFPLMPRRAQRRRQRSEGLTRRRLVGGRPCPHAGPHGAGDCAGGGLLHMSFVTRRKPIALARQGVEVRELRRTLSWPHLIALGVGAIIGTGIYTLIGVGAGQAGPGVILSFAIAGAVCAFAALCYAEMATLMPQAGSAYTYAYAGMGELVAWI